MRLQNTLDFFRCIEEIRSLNIAQICETIGLAERRNENILNKRRFKMRAFMHAAQDLRPSRTGFRFTKAYEEVEV